MNASNAPTKTFQRHSAFIECNLNHSGTNGRYFFLVERKNQNRNKSKLGQGAFSFCSHQFSPNCVAKQLTRSFGDIDSSHVITVKYAFIRNIQPKPLNAMNRVTSMRIVFFSENVLISIETQFRLKITYMTWLIIYCERFCVFSAFVILSDWCVAWFHQIMLIDFFVFN